MIRKTALISFTITLPFLILALLCGLVACHRSGESTETTDAVTDTPTEAVTTEAATTEAPETVLETWADLRPAIDIPADAAAVDALIASVDGATRENEDKLDLAYLGYWSLSEEERAKVTGYETLQTLRSELTKAYVVKEYMDTRIPHHKFLIGTWFGPPSYTDATVREMVDASIDYVWMASPYSDPDTRARAWDLLERYGIGMFNLSYHQGFSYGTVEGDWDRPNLWALTQRDEPPASLFETLGSDERLLMEHFPECGYLDNLFPNYASSQQLEIPLYKSYLERYLDQVTTDIVCYDHYPYSITNQNEALKKWLDNLADAQAVCLDYGKDLYVAGQINNLFADKIISTDHLRFQAYSAMAYGAKSISWACWTTGWWEHNVYMNGERTEQYEKLVEVNAELKALDPIFMRYTGTAGGYLLNKPNRDSLPGETFDMLSRLRQTGMKKIDKTVVTDFTVSGTDVIQIGQFTKNVGEGSALMLLNITDFTYETKTTATVTFKVADMTSVVTAYVKGIPTVLEPDENGIYTVEVSGADAVFLTLS